MTIVIKKGDSIEAIINDFKQEVLDKKRALKEKPFGKVIWEEDAVVYQKRMRDEWN